VIAGPLAKGAAKHGPYDVVTLQGGVEVIPADLFAQVKDGGRIAAVFMDGVVGRAMVGYKRDGQVTWRFAFNATAPVLPGFAATRAFAL
jgi:protein-L-isoaspartate(D-aspartate) O-methyltransferase